MTAPAWCMARASRSAWRWRTAFRRASTSPARTTLCASRRICATSACRGGWPTFRAALPDAEQLLGYIAQDKKVTRGALTFILTRGVGQSFIARDVPASEVLAFLQDNHPG